MWPGGMMVWMTLFWVGVVVLAIWIAGRLFPSTGAEPERAQEILRARRARGELTPEQYETMRDVLVGPAPRGARAAAAGAGLVIAVLAIGAIAAWGGRSPWMGPGGWRGSMPHMGWAQTTPSTSLPGGAALRVDAVDFGFRPAEVRIEAGEPVNLTLVNRGAVAHDLTIPALGVRMVAQPGQQTTAGVRAPAGVYEFYCSVPGHREAGMVGRLVVRE